MFRQLSVGQINYQDNENVNTQTLIEGRAEDSQGADSSEEEQEQETRPLIK